MSLERVAFIPRCAECDDVWLPADDARWRAYLDDEDQVVLFCPECAETRVR